MYMSMLVYNEPGVTGYSVLWGPSGTHRMKTLRSHTAVEDTKFYEDFEDVYRGVWLYFPLLIGERISEIWNIRPPGRNQHWEPQSSLLVSIPSAYGQGHGLPLLAYTCRNFGSADIYFYSSRRIPVALHILDLVANRNTWKFQSKVL